MSTAASSSSSSPSPSLEGSRSGAAAVVAVLGGILFTLAHLLPMAAGDGATFFEVRNDEYWNESGEIHHVIARAYFGFGWLLAFAAVAVGVVLALRGRRSFIAALLAATAGVAHLVTITTQAYVGPKVPVIAMGIVGAVLVAGAVVGRSTSRDRPTS